MVNYPNLIFFGHHRFASMKERNPLNFSQYFKTWLYTRLFFNQIHVNKLLWILSPYSGNMIVAYVYFTFFTKYREVQVLGIRNLSRKMALKMIPIQKTGLHFFEFRAQGQRICKLFKLTRYFIFYYCLLQTRHYGCVMALLS